MFQSQVGLVTYQGLTLRIQGTDGRCLGPRRHVSFVPFHAYLVLLLVVLRPASAKIVLTHSCWGVLLEFGGRWVCILICPCDYESLNLLVLH
jgi:hypothetical protein